MMSGSRNDLDNPPVAMAELRAVAGWRQLVRALIMPAERSSSSELLASGSHSGYVYSSDAVAPRWDSSATPGTSGETICSGVSDEDIYSGVPLTPPTRPARGAHFSG